MDKIVIPAEVERLATLSVDAAFAVHTELGPGLLESAYEACLVRELRKRGLPVECQVGIPVLTMGKI